jgi:hypothetical protein
MIVGERHVHARLSQDGADRHRVDPALREEPLRGRNCLATWTSQGDPADVRA